MDDKTRADFWEAIAEAREESNLKFIQAVRDVAKHGIKAADYERLQDRLNTLEGFVKTLVEVSGAPCPELLYDTVYKAGKRIAELEKAFKDAQFLIDCLPGDNKIATSRENWHRMKADSELGRLVRAMPATYYLYRFSGKDHWALSCDLNKSSFESKTPEEALRAAGIK